MKHDFRSSDSGGNCIIDASTCRGKQSCKICEIGNTGLGIEYIWVGTTEWPKQPVGDLVPKTDNSDGDTSVFERYECALYVLPESI